MDLVKVMADATMKAYVLHADGRDIDSERACMAMRSTIKNGWAEFKETTKNALDANMGDETYRAILNTYANAWAVEALAIS